MSCYYLILTLTTTSSYTVVDNDSTGTIDALHHTPLTGICSQSRYVLHRFYQNFLKEMYGSTVLVLFFLLSRAVLRLPLHHASFDSMLT